MFIILVRMSEKKGYPFCDLFFNKSDKLLLSV